MTKEKATSSGKGLKIHYEKSESGEMVPMEVGSSKILVRYMKDGELSYCSTRKSDTFYLYKVDGDTAKIVSKSKNPYDLDKIAFAK